MNNRATGNVNTDVTAETWRFGPFHFDPTALTLSRDGRPIPLQQQPARVLSALLARPGEVVTREHLRQAIWGDAWVNFDQGLNYCVRQIRIALDDDVRAPRYVQTLPQRGYRFVAGVAVAPAAATRRSMLPAIARQSAVAAALIAAGLILGLQAAAITIREVAPASEAAKLAEHVAPVHFISGAWTHHVRPLISTPPRR